MKATGIVRRVDELGRFVIPKELRRKYNINDYDSMEVFTDEKGLYLQKYSPEEDIVLKVDELSKSIDNIYLDLGEDNTKTVLDYLSKVKEILEESEKESN